MAGHGIFTLGATPVDVDFVQQYKNVGVDLESESDIYSSGDSKCYSSPSSNNDCDPASDDFSSDDDSDDPSSSELSDLDSTGKSDIPALLTCSFVHATDDCPQKCNKHVK